MFKIGVTKCACSPEAVDVQVASDGRQSEIIES